MKYKASGARVLPSLRRRYFSQTLILSLVVIGVVLFFFLDTVSIKQEATDNITINNHKLKILDQIDANLIKIFHNIDSFLLDPTAGNFDKLAQKWIKNSIQTSSELQVLLKEDVKIFSEAENLANTFIQFQTDYNHLEQLRKDVSQQFPGFSMAGEKMTPLQQSVTSTLQRMIDEIESGEFEPFNDNLYHDLLKAYISWVNVISQARIYYTNRFTSLSLNILSFQADSLTDYHNKFIDKVGKLKPIYANEDSFEGESNVEVLRSDAVKWFTVFQQVRQFSESDKWRGDTYLMQALILPQLEGISDTIKGIDGYLKNEQKAIKQRLDKATNSLLTLLVVVICLFLLFIITILYSLDRMIFDPISSVSNALKSRAFNIEAPQLKSGTSLEISSLIDAFQEMDEKVDLRQNELQYQVMHDHLTGLPNRFMLNQRLEYQLISSERNHSSFILFFMDLDRFKDVNDTFGHAIGDLLLMEVAKRLSSNVRKVDTIARLGGDEFAVLLPGCDTSEAKEMAENLTNVINSTFVIKKESINIASSIGIVSYPRDGSDSKTLLQHADIAMYEAKKNKQDFVYYDDHHDIYSQNRLTLINDLCLSIDNDRLELYYQPQIHISSNRIVGAEALLRWQHPEFGFINPEKIVELAEYSGNIHKLTFWVMKNAIKECKKWHQNHFDIDISVNLSVHDFTKSNFCEQVEKLLLEHQLPAKNLTLEITENSMMGNMGRSIEIINVLNMMGIKLSIDDFGTGFSSLSYLKQLPVNELKIDKSFVFEMDKNENDKVIVQSIIQLGHNLGLNIVAEGIESQIHLDLNRGFNCDIAQGYHFSKPLNKLQFHDYLKEKFKN